MARRVTPSAPQESMDCFVAPLLRALDSYASVSIVKQGRRVVAFEAQAWQDDPTKPIASAFGHFMLRKIPDADEE
jgi:hypothetical protein